MRKNSSNNNKKLTGFRGFVFVVSLSLTRLWITVSVYEVLWKRSIYALDKLKRQGGGHGSSGTGPLGTEYASNILKRQGDHNMVKRLKAGYVANQDNVANTDDLHLNIPVVDGDVMRHSDSQAHEIR